MSVRIKTAVTTKAAFTPVFVISQPEIVDLVGEGTPLQFFLAKDPAGVTQASTGTTGVSRPASAGSASSALPVGALDDHKIYLKTCTKGGCATRFLDIVDLINLVEPIVEDQILRNDQGTEIILRSGKKRQSLESIYIEKWCLGNTRIMYALLQSGELNIVTVKDYVLPSQSV